MAKGGSAPDSLVWSSEALTKQRARLNPAVRDLALLPGPTTLWTKGWQGWPRAMPDFRQRCVDSKDGPEGEWSGTLVLGGAP